MGWRFRYFVKRISNYPQQKRYIAYSRFIIQITSPAALNRAKVLCTFGELTTLYHNPFASLFLFLSLPQPCSLKILTKTARLS